MSDDPVVSQLVMEATELLAIGQVGLYELRWILRGINTTLDEDAIVSMSASALSELRAGGFDLGWFVWPEGEPRELETGSPGDLGDVWSEPHGTRPYLAVCGRVS
jgi:hypothetical protein